MKVKYGRALRLLCSVTLVAHTSIAFVYSPTIAIASTAKFSSSSSRHSPSFRHKSAWTSTHKVPTHRVRRGGRIRCARHASTRGLGTSMSTDFDPMDRRGLLRVLGVGVAGLATAASTVLSQPEQAEAAVNSVARRPLAKRKPPALCDDTVTYLRNPSTQSETWIVGTAHISNSSAQLVGDVIREIKPQVVMVELDEQRVKRFIQEAEKEDALQEGGVAPALPLASVKPVPIFAAFVTQMLDSSITFNDRVTDFFAVAVGKVISKMYESLGEQGYSPGQEFTVALREAKRCGAKILLGDRNVQDTLKRLSQAIRATDFDELALRSQAELGMSLQGLEFGSAEDIGENAEKLKSRDMMSKLVNVYKEEAPELYMALIGERDKVMAVNLMTLEPKQTTVAVVGLAHVEGIEAILVANGWQKQRC